MCGGSNPFVAEVISNAALSSGKVVPIPTNPMELVVPVATAVVAPVDKLIHYVPT
jgi:hypothetical protein